MCNHDDLIVCDPVRQYELVIERHPTYIVVRKDGVAGLVALEEDPRA